MSSSATSLGYKMNNIHMMHECDQEGFDSSKEFCPECEAPETAEDRIPEQRLKLFKVTVFPSAARNTGLALPREEALVLDINEDDACDNVLSAMGYADPSERTRVEIDLIDGPFEAGRILSHMVWNR